MSLILLSLLEENYSFFLCLFYSNLVVDCYYFHLSMNLYKCSKCLIFSSGMPLSSSSILIVIMVFRVTCLAHFHFSMVSGTYKFSNASDVINTAYIFSRRDLTRQDISLVIFLWQWLSNKHFSADGDLAMNCLLPHTHKKTPWIYDPFLMRIRKICKH